MNRRQIAWMAVYSLLLTTSLTLVPMMLDAVAPITDDAWLSNLRVVSVSMFSASVVAWLIFRMRGQEGE